MKQFLLIAALALIGFSAKAQGCHNNSDCEIEYRQVCIDPLTCTVSYPTTTWTSVPAHTITMWAISACAPGEVIGFEVQYGGSTGCSNPPVTVYDISTPTPPSCTGIFMNAQLGFCRCDPANPNGVNIHFNGLNLHIDN